MMSDRKARKLVRKLDRSSDYEIPIQACFFRQAQDEDDSVTFDVALMSTAYTLDSSGDDGMEIAARDNSADIYRTRMLNDTFSVDGVLDVRFDGVLVAEDISRGAYALAESVGKSYMKNIETFCVNTHMIDRYNLSIKFVLSRDPEMEHLYMDMHIDAKRFIPNMSFLLTARCRPASTLALVMPWTTDNVSDLALYERHEGLTLVKTNRISIGEGRCTYRWRVNRQDTFTIFTPVIEMGDARGSYMLYSSDLLLPPMPTDSALWNSIGSVYVPEDPRVEHVLYMHPKRNRFRRFIGNKGRKMLVTAMSREQDVRDSIKPREIRPNVPGPDRSRR